MSQLLASSGLVLDVLGAAVLFFYGPPQPDFQEDDVVIIKDNRRAAEVKKLKAKFIFSSRFGLFLLFAGFILQFVGMWC